VSARVVFGCDHVGCDEAYVLDTKHHHCNDPACGAVDTIPVELAPVIAFLTEAKGWRFALDQQSDGLLLFAKCFCPAHAEDVKTLAGYAKDELAERRARRK
jgi:hypothetical protein